MRVQTVLDTAQRVEGTLHISMCVLAAIFRLATMRGHPFLLYLVIGAFQTPKGEHAVCEPQCQFSFAPQ